MEEKNKTQRKILKNVMIDRELVEFLEERRKQNHTNFSQELRRALWRYKDLMEGR